MVRVAGRGLRGLLIGLVCVASIGCSSADAPDQSTATGDTAAATSETDAETDAATASEPVTYRPVIVNTYHHDRSAYTQGLEFIGDQLLESTGLDEGSSIRLVDPETGEVERFVPLDDLYGEGATVVGDEVWQLTWRNETLVIYDANDLRELRRIGYQGEGWGLCATPERLVMSDGSAELEFRDRVTFDVLDSVTVTDGGDPVDDLNELECVGDRVWANIYQTNRIVEIDPDTGVVVGSIDATELVPEEFRSDRTNVLNGIAYDDNTGRLWLTGKRWPEMYEVDLVEVPDEG